MTSVLQMESLVDELVLFWNQRMLEFVGPKPFDFSVWTNYLTMDVISKLAYGNEFGHLKTGQDINGIMEALQGGFDFRALINWAPAFKSILGSAPMRKLFPVPETSGFSAIRRVSFS